MPSGPCPANAVKVQHVQHFVSCQQHSRSTRGLPERQAIREAVARSKSDLIAARGANRSSGDATGTIQGRRTLSPANRPAGASQVDHRDRILQPREVSHCAAVVRSDEFLHFPIQEHKQRHQA